MSNPHFEGVLLKKDNVELFIPRSWIFNNGKLKKYAITAWKRELAKANNMKKPM